LSKIKKSDTRSLRKGRPRTSPIVKNPFVKNIPTGEFSLFDDLKDQIKNSPERSAQWFQTKIRKLRSITDTKLLSATDRLSSTVYPGAMCMYRYDPKTKDELPYYDMFPLVLPFTVDSKGFTGLNLHYLPPILRLKLLERLLVISTNKNLEPVQRLRMSWSLLSNAARFPEVRPCVKRYLWNHCESKFFNVMPDEWSLVIFLPLEQFAFASTAKVWSDSRRQIGIR
jgi:hypothetical protein